MEYDSTKYLAEKSNFRVKSVKMQLTVEFHEIYTDDQSILVLVMTWHRPPMFTGVYVSV